MQTVYFLVTAHAKPFVNTNNDILLITTQTYAVLVIRSGELKENYLFW